MKSKTTAAILAIFLGGLGIHKFYLGKGVQGLLYLLFSWTFIPAMIALIEGIMYLTMDDRAFQRKYGTRQLPPANHGAGSQNAQNITVNMPGQSNNNTNVSDELNKLAKLRESGVLTEEEFQAQKTKLLQ